MVEGKVRALYDKSADISSRQQNTWFELSDKANSNSLVRATERKMSLIG